MLVAEGSVQVAASPREVLELACDLRAYMALDGKIVNVYENPPIGSDGNGLAVIRGSVRGIRSPKQRLAVKLDRWWSVTFESAGPWLTDRLMWFRGGFVAQPSHGGSWVTHSYRFRFKGPLGPLFERYLRGWLEQDVNDELQRIKTHFDRRAAGLPPLQVPHRRQARADGQPTRAGKWRDFIGGGGV